MGLDLLITRFDHLICNGLTISIEYDFMWRTNLVANKCFANVCCCEKCSRKMLANKWCWREISGYYFLMFYADINIYGAFCILGSWVSLPRRREFSEKWARSLVRKGAQLRRYLHEHLWRIYELFRSNSALRTLHIW